MIWDIISLILWEMKLQIRTNPQCTVCTNNYEENVNHVLLECEAYTNLRNELNSDITTLFCGQNVDASFTGLPPHGKNDVFNR